jgi:hypothetical protein
MAMAIAPMAMVPLRLNASPINEMCRYPQPLLLAAPRPEDAMAHPLAPQFSSSQAVIWVCR